MSRVPVIFDRADPSSPIFYPASQSALLLLDYHNMIVSRCGANGPKAVAQAAVMRDWALQQGFLVVHCLIGFDKAPPASMKAAARFGSYFKLLESNPQEIAEHDALSLKPGREADEVVLYRLGGVVSALQSYGIKELLAEGGKRKDGIKNLVVGGLSTSGCTLSTAKAAADQGFVVTVLGDMCADATPGLHEMLLERVFPSNCHVSSVEEFQGK